MLLNAGQILSARDKRTIEVDVPEWGKDAKVLIGTLGALARARIAEYFFNNEQLRSQTEKEKREDEIITTDSPDPDDGQIDEEDIAEPEIRVKVGPVTNLKFKLEYLKYSILDPETYLPAFTAEQLEQLGEKDKDVIERLYEAAVDLNLETKEAIEDAEKNSGKTTGEGSGSD